MTKPRTRMTREYMTADGRDLSREEWRTIPGFPIYEITYDGDVRNKRSGRLLKELQNKTTDAWYYSVRDQDGKVRNRGYESLVNLAWDNEGQEEIEEWKSIPHFPTYEITKNGRVRNARTKKVLGTENIPKYHGETVRLHQNDIKHRMLVRNLVSQAWPEEQEAA